MMVAQFVVDRILAEAPGMDGLTAYRVAQSREIVQRRAGEMRRQAIAQGRGIYK